jgi:Flp pilus assembly protein TadD
MRVCSIFIVFLLSCVLAGCETDKTFNNSSIDSETPAPTLTVQDAADVKYYPSDEPLRLANENYSRGNFGIAAKYYEDAVTRAHEDATAWIGLAASYDRVGRFDLADRAYKQAIRLVGETTQILNNEGYSYMLRGNLVEARRKLVAADQRDPNNPVIVNNLNLLNSSGRAIVRETGK